MTIGIALRWSWGIVALVVFPCACFAFASSSNTASPYQRAEPIPITVLAGFLGSGKTTLLKNLLENSEGLKIAVVVNDVASVNIDSKLVSSMDLAAGMVELQSGCVCCSKSEELLASVAELVIISDMREQGFDHIVVEMSGVADPKSVRSKFQEAELYDMPLLERVKLDTMVTLVDCSTFLDYLQSTKTASPEEAPELFYRKGDEPDGSSDVFKSLRLAQQGEDNSVADLIVSQVETSDIILLNKIDLAKGRQLVQIDEMVRALNPRALVVRTAFADVPSRGILGVANGTGVAQAGVVDDHKDSVHAASCHDPQCTDASHNRFRDHTEVKSQVAGSNPDCTDSDSSLAHSHEHTSISSKKHDNEHSCSDPDCSDPSHTHSHDVEVTMNHAGIGSFVYRARRPFHPGRLVTFLKSLPVRRGVPENLTHEIDICERARKILRRVVRSKGFTWCANSHSSALYWSHAGCSFDLSCLGSWWATLPRNQWPHEAVNTILQDFDSANHVEDDPHCRSVGDRRQEIVFIGPTMGDAESQNVIEQTLDQCLLNDDEWLSYKETCTDESTLVRIFPSALQAIMMSY
jgi:G3E family GTPase